MILLVIALFGGIVFLSFYVEALIIDVMLVPIMIVFLGIGLNYFIACLCGDEIYNTGWVNKGNSMFAIKLTPKYYQRKKFIDFIQCLFYVAYLTTKKFRYLSIDSLAISCVVIINVMMMNIIEKFKKC
jgi:hypothetical protein